MIKTQQLSSLCIALSLLVACNHLGDSAKTASVDHGGGPSASCGDTALTGLVQSFNRDAWTFAPQAKQLQLSAMASSPAEFYRVTPYVYYALLQRRMKADPTFQQQIAAAGTGSIYADVHPLNVAWSQQDHGAVAWVNDFDDTTAAPFAADLLRSLSSILVFAPSASAVDVGSSFLKAYVSARSGATPGDRSPDLDALAAKASLTSDNLTSDQPQASKEALEAASAALAAAPLNPAPAIGSCRVKYKVYAGGSSEGLPRFRLSCDGLVYELKAARLAAWDAAADLGAADQAARIVAGAKLLGAKDAGPFFLAPNLKGLDSTGPWSYYGHLRSGQSLDVSNLSAADAVAVGTVLGGLLGAGHKRAGAAPLDTATAAMLQTFLPSTAADLATGMNDLQRTLPNCL